MKIIIFSTLLLILPATIMASIKHAPPAFNTEDGKAVFVDFKKADYSLKYDPLKKTLTAESIITFETFEEGMPIFDMVENPSLILLNGIKVSTKVISSPDVDTWFRVALKNLKPGIHTFSITSFITQGILFLPNGVSSAFWLNDLGDRALLESYLPANFEYDQYKMTLFIDFKTMGHQKIYSNGLITKKENNKFIVEFPETYNSAALYYHTAPVGRFLEENFNYASITGKDIPAVVYSKGSIDHLKNIKTQVIAMLDKLESTYGPWLHDTIVIHIISEGGGMEYSGATMTDLGLLNHELTHSYFARGGLMPSNGNAGWLDEAITVWSDSGMNTKSNIDGVVANMAGQSLYRRYTDNRAYSIGSSFMEYLHYYFQGRGGLVPFLNHLIQTKKFAPMNTEEFINLLVHYYDDDISILFKNHVFKDEKHVSKQVQKRVPHMKMSISEMTQFL